MGLTRTEEAILNLSDAGLSIGQVTRMLGYRRSTVMDVVRKYDVNLGQDRIIELAIRNQTARLGALVRQAGGHR